ncbi:MAG: sialate O-acetylesterase [Verrucomicrobia bacterium]|nr:MAG: sialate O-acetylesterase [Verrucomicrobiota bacterium]
MNSKTLRCGLLITFICLLPSVAAADALRLPAIFGNHMVLQRDQPIPVWGWSDPGAEVTVSFRDQRVTTITRADGQWTATLAAESTGESADLIVLSGDDLVFTDVLVGDVWVASGQSNMSWTVSNSNNAEAEIEAADHPDIRLFTLKRRVSTEPLREAGGSWVACTPEATKGFSAVAYFFGRELQEELDVPIGLINTSWGGTPAEAWTSIGALAANPELTSIIEQRTRDIVNYPEKLSVHIGELAAWAARRVTAESDGAEFTERKPRGPRGPEHPHLPAGLYNGMIQPLIPYGIRGVIWYQGESNGSRPEQYATLFPTMIRDWRRQWGQGAFPFLFVQLANFMPNGDESGRVWAFLREAQTQTLRLPNTGMAVTIDIGNPDDIHPRNKQDVGKRLALAAQAVAYDQSVIASGPMFSELTIDGSEAVISFSNAETGLTGVKGKVLGFEIAGKDRIWVPATATISGAKVLVSNPVIPEPVAVRYAWANSPEATLANGVNLPAVPFRTDDWSRE